MISTLKKYFHILILIFITDIAFSQNPKIIDSLEKRLISATEDTPKINTLNALSAEYENNNTSKSLQYANEAMKISMEKNYSKGIITAFNNIGNVYNTQGNYDAAIENYNKLFSLANELHDTTGMSTALINIGNAEKHRGNYNKAIEYYLKSLKLQESTNIDLRMKGVTLNHIGMVYQFQKKFSDALDYYNQSLDIYVQLNDSVEMAKPFTDIGNVYAEQGDFDKAGEYYIVALNIYKKINDGDGISACLTNLGIVYYEKGEPEKSLKTFLESLELSKKIGDNNSIADAYTNIANFYEQEKKYNTALLYLDTALDISKGINAKPNIESIYYLMAEIHGLIGNFKHAYEFHLLYSQIRDSLFSEESSKQIAEMQTKYETEKKELQIENLNKDNAIKETEIKKQNFQKLAFASGFGLMLILAFVIFKGYKQKQKVNEIITSQKIEVEKQKEIVDEKNQSLEVAYKHIEEKNTEILDSIRYAKRIQEAILPPQKLVQSYLENSFILYKPKDIVAGDFYWMHTGNLDFAQSPEKNSSLSEAETSRSMVAERSRSHRILFASVDCTGHGVPGAFMSILGFNGLNRCVKEFGLTQPSKILDKLCELVDEAFSKSEADIKDGMDIALCALEFPSPSERDGRVRLQYSGAGNSLYHIHNGILKEYKADKQPIGKYAYRKPFTNHTIELPAPLNSPEGGKPTTLAGGSPNGLIRPLADIAHGKLPPSGGGGAFYIFTDGYADQFGGPKGKKFKYSQFENLLISIQDKSMSEQREILNETIESWKGELDQIDDICIIGVRI